MGESPGAFLEEQEAVRRCQGGNLTALGVLFELHHRAVVRTAYGIVRDQYLAEDIVQQVFVELFSSIKGYDRQRAFVPWLHRIAVNLSLDQLRHRSRRDLPLERAADLQSSLPSPYEAAEESESHEAIWRAIGDLSPKHRAAVVLRYYHGFSESEMAMTLNCRRGTVKSRLHTALRRIGETLTAQAPSLVTSPERDFNQDKSSGEVT